MGIALAPRPLKARGKGTRVAKPEAPPSVPLIRIELVSSMSAAGNLAMQRKFQSGEEKAEITETSATTPRRQESALLESAPQVDPAIQPTPVADKTPTTAEQDPQHQFVAKQLAIKAKKEKTLPKTPEQKQEETLVASKLPPEIVTREKTETDDFNKLANIPAFTVEGFMKEFDQEVEKLGKKIPEKKEGSSPEDYDDWNGKRNKAMLLVHVEQENTKEELVKQQKASFDPLRREKGEKVPVSADVSGLQLDPVGNVQSIPQAKVAAPKPKAEKEISLDDQSRALDDAFVGHNVGGQTINIDESSLAFPVSGEKSFDEAGETKRRAQDEIVKAKPRYREQEHPVVGTSQHQINSLVNVTALKGQHAVRAEKFKGVLDAQQLHGGKIKTDKRDAFADLENEYEETKRKVTEELDKVKPETLEGLLQEILKEEEDDFAENVEKNLEYIYTPGHLGLDYSDWIDEHQEEVNQLTAEFRKGNDFDTAAYFRALIAVQDKSAQELFIRAKHNFIYWVKDKIEKRIAKLVVDALNAARGHIAQGRVRVQEKYDKLPKEEKEGPDAKRVLEAIQGKFQSLEESVVETQHEVIADMARTYNQSVGKLQAKFDEIKKDVLTSWLEKAWNKIKAVVNAIIEFAKRIFQLLARIAGLAADIISSPRVFFRNLAAGISEGFSTFINRIDEYLATAFFDWLRGSSGPMIQLPKDWGPKGIFSLFTQLLGLSLETIWERMEVVYDKTVADAFRRGEAVIEKGLEIFAIIKNEGLSGLWDHIVDSLGTILDDTLEMIKETVLYAAIKKVIFEIGKMLVPGGGFIAIAEKIIRIVTFIVEARDKILDLIESFISSMENAVKGDLAGIVSKVTEALTKFITVALDFLVSFFGLGALKEKVERFIERMRKPVIRGIDFVLMKFRPLVMKGKELFEKGKEKVLETGRAIAQAGLPKDPNERLEMGLQAAVKVVDALSGRAVTQAIITPTLSAVRIRYGFTSLVPVVEDGVWWVEGHINPAAKKRTRKKAGSQATNQQDLESLVKRLKLTYPLDGLKRPDGPSGHITGVKRGDDRDSMTSSFMRGYQPGDQRGHLIGDRFYGSAKPENLVPMHRNLNLSDYKTYENTIGTKALELTDNGKPVMVHMHAKPKYTVDDEMNEESFRPTSVTLSATLYTLKSDVDPPTVEHEEIISPPLPNPPAEVTSVKINGDLNEMKAALRILVHPRIMDSRLERKLVDYVVKVRKETKFADPGDFRLKAGLALGDYAYLLTALKDYEIDF